MLSSFLYTMFKPSKTSPNKLFDYDCVTLYLNNIFNGHPPHICVGYMILFFTYQYILIVMVIFID